MNFTGRLFLPFFMAILLLSNPVNSALAFDGDGDFDASDSGNDSGEDTDPHDSHELGHDGAGGQDPQERDGDHHAHGAADGRTDELPQGKENDADHHRHARHHHADAWPIWGPAWGFAPVFGGFGWGSFGGGGFGGFGGPGYGAFGYGMPYYPPAYYSPPVMVAPSPPPTYVQRDAAQSTPGFHPGYWYYCRDPEGYYPHVQECPGSWEQVAPQATEDSRK